MNETTHFPRTLGVRAAAATRLPHPAGVPAGRIPACRRLGRLAGLAGLAIGMLFLVAACSTAPGSPPKAATGPATPAQNATPTSSPSASSPSAASSAGSSASVTGRPATSSEVAELTTAAQDECGFTGNKYILTQARVTNNGWAMATVTARNPIYQGNTQIIFHYGAEDVPPHWVFNTCGSDFRDSGIPRDVLSALAP